MPESLTGSLEGGAARDGLSEKNAATVSNSNHPRRGYHNRAQRARYHTAFGRISPRKAGYHTREAGISPGALQYATHALAARFPHKRCGNRADPPMTGNMNETTRNFACGEDSLALRLVSELPDRRAANADRDLASLACKVLSAFGSNTSKQKHGRFGPCFCLEAPPGIGPGIKVLQTSALPLGYGALSAGISLPYSNPSVKHKFTASREKT